MKAINKVERSQLDFHDGKETMPPDTINKNELLEGYLTSQSSYISEMSLSTILTDLNVVPSPRFQNHGLWLLIHIKKN